MKGYPLIACDSLSKSNIPGYSGHSTQSLPLQPQPSLISPHSLRSHPRAQLPINHAYRIATEINTSRA